MTLQLYGHPFSSYTWKALIALYENDTPFDFRMLGPDYPENNAAIEVRMLDRFFDNYVMTPMQKIVGDALRSESARDQHGAAEARAQLDTAYHILDRWIVTREWAGAGQFSLADCAAAPSLFYADWVHPIPDSLTHAKAYRARLLARPSVARAVDEARPYRHFFPLGTPDRD